MPSKEGEEMNKICKNCGNMTRSSIKKDEIFCDKAFCLPLNDPSGKYDQVYIRTYLDIKINENFGCIHWRKKERILTSLENYNAARRPPYGIENSPRLNGIACPDCEVELFDDNSRAMITSTHGRKVHCVNCGFVGYKIA